MGLGASMFSFKDGKQSFFFGGGQNTQLEIWPPRICVLKGGLQHWQIQPHHDSGKEDLEGTREPFHKKRNKALV